MAAKKSRLGELHAQFTELLIRELEIQLNGQGGSEDGTWIPMTASDKQVIVAFLKNNEITADADTTEGSRLGELFKEAMEAERKKKADQILKKDSDEFTSMILQ